MIESGPTMNAIENKAITTATTVHEHEIAAIVERGRADVAEGRITIGLDAARERMHALWGRGD